jgi:hypothetical protein
MNFDLEKSALPPDLREDYDLKNFSGKGETNYYMF